MDAVWRLGIAQVLTPQRLSPGLDQAMAFLSFLGGEEFFMLLKPLGLDGSSAARAGHLHFSRLPGRNLPSGAT